MPYKIVYILIILTTLLISSCRQDKLFRSVLIPVEKYNKYGLIDQNGNLVVDIKYQDLRLSENNQQFICTKHGRKGILDQFGKVLHNCTYDYISDLYGGYIGTKGEQQYILSPSGKSTKVNTTVTLYWKNGLYISKNKEGKTSLINEDCDEILPHIYKSVVPLDNSYNYFRFFTEFNRLNLSTDLLYVDMNDKEGIVNIDGKILIKPEYVFISAFIDGKAFFVKEDKIGVLDTNGNTLFEGDYDKLNGVDKNVSSSGFRHNTEINDQWASKKLHFVQDFKDVFPIVGKKDGSYTLITDKIQKTLSKNDIKYAYHYRYNYIKLAKDNYVNLLDSELDEIFPFIYNDLYLISKDRFIVLKDNKYGIINNENKILTPIIYDSIRLIEPPSFTNNTLILAFKKDIKWSLGYNYNKLLTSYDFISMPLREFYFGTWERTPFIKVETEKGIGLIDTTGKYIIEPSKEFIGFGIFENIILSKDTNNHKYSSNFSKAYDSNGNPVFEAKDVEITYTENKNVFSVSYLNSEGKYRRAYINTKGKWIWKPE